LDGTRYYLTQWKIAAQELEQLLVFDYGLASKWASFIKEKVPIAILGENEWRDDHGVGRVWKYLIKGIALYKIDGIYLLLTGASFDSSILAEAIYAIAKTAQISFLSLDQQSPDKKSKLVSVSSRPGTDDFHIGTGLGASLISLVCSQLI
jgi:hypothetical protein